MIANVLRSFRNCKSPLPPHALATKKHHAPHELIKCVGVLSPDVARNARALQAPSRYRRSASAFELVARDRAGDGQAAIAMGRSSPIVELIASFVVVRDPSRECATQAPPSLPSHADLQMLP